MRSSINQAGITLRLWGQGNSPTCMCHPLSATRTSWTATLKSLTFSSRANLLSQSWSLEGLIWGFSIRKVLAMSGQLLLTLWSQSWRAPWRVGTLSIKTMRAKRQPRLQTPSSSSSLTCWTNPRALWGSHMKPWCTFMASLIPRLPLSQRSPLQSSCSQ